MGTEDEGNHERVGNEVEGYARPSINAAELHGMCNLSERGVMDSSSTQAAVDLGEWGEETER